MTCSGIAAARPIRSTAQPRVLPEEVDERQLHHHGRRQRVVVRDHAAGRPDDGAAAADHEVAGPLDAVVAERDHQHPGHADQARLRGQQREAEEHRHQDAHHPVPVVPGDHRHRRRQRAQRHPEEPQQQQPGQQVGREALALLRQQPAEHGRHRDRAVQRLGMQQPVDLPVRVHDREPLPAHQARGRGDDRERQVEQHAEAEDDVAHLALTSTGLTLGATPADSRPVDWEHAWHGRRSVPCLRHRHRPRDVVGVAERPRGARPRATGACSPCATPPPPASRRRRPGAATAALAPAVSALTALPPPATAPAPPRACPSPCGR